MSLSDQIQQVWAISAYPSPKIHLIFYNDEYMATVDDSENFLRFISIDG